MYKKRSVLVIIPARGGSKRLPGKNIRTLGGVPLIEHVIRAAHHSRYADAIVVSTDSLSIARASRRAGAAVPFMRPKRLATHQAPVIDTLLHALAHYKKEGWEPDLVVMLQPTSPFVTGADIDAAIRTLIATGSDSCVSVTPVAERPEWMFSLAGPKRLMQPLLTTADMFARSQDMPPLYRLNGAVYASLRTALQKNKKTFNPKNCTAIVMPRDRSVDIDHEDDFAHAVRLLKKK